MPNGAQAGSPYGGGEPASTGDYFSDTAGGKEQQGESPKETPEQDEEGGETAILPKSVLGGKEFKPGDEVVLKIVRMHDDNVEVTYAEEKGEGEGEEQMAKAPMPQGAGGGGGGDAEMASMME